MAGSDHAGVRLPPPLILGGFLAAGFVLEWLWPAALFPTAVGLAFGALLLLIGAGLVIWSSLLFHRRGTALEPWRPSSTLVAEGPYRWSRNPIYLGGLLAYVGIALMADALWPLILLPFLVLILRHAVIGREERYLARRFGPDYEAYRKRVRRWI